MDGTIAAVATPPGEGGIGIIRISGKSALSIADKLFLNIEKKKLSELEERKLSYGHIIDPKTDGVIDEVMTVFMSGPKTYTTEDVVEIHCHGGIIPVRRILELVLDCGAEPAECGEFTKRAFLNGRIDLSQAEAVMDLISAKTDSSFDMSLRQLKGSLSSEVTTLIDSLMEMLAHIEASIDFPEDDVEEMAYEKLLRDSTDVLSKIDHLIESFNTGKILKDGLKTVILGKPNVGKSSLMNAILRENRAIVTDIPGTTRDIIEEYVNIKGIPLKVVDTAGIRETEDLVEQLGVDRAKDILEQSDLAIVVFDASRELDSEDLEIIELVRSRKSIVLLNKTDLSKKLTEKDIESYLPSSKIINTAITEGSGIDKLEQLLHDMFMSSDVKITDSVVINNTRHRDLLMKSKKNMTEAIESINISLPIDCIEVDIKNAIENLGEITGDSVGEDIINTIFKNFCIGK